MHPHSGTGRFEAVHSSRKQTCNEPSEDVSRPGRGQGGWRVVVDDESTIGRGDHRLVTLQYHDPTNAPGRPDCASLTITLHVEQSRELTLVWRQHQLTTHGPGQDIELPNETRQRIGVEQGVYSPPQTLERNFPGGLPHTRTGADDRRIRLNQQRSPLMSIVGRLDEDAFDRGQVRIERRTPRADRHHACAGTGSRARGEACCAGHRIAAIHDDVSTGVLVGINVECRYRPQRRVVARAHPTHAIAELLGVLLFLFRNLATNVIHVDFANRRDQLIER